MSLQVRQDYEYLGSDTWKWWVWIDGADHDLDQVDAVEYHLHPTFPRPVRLVKDRSTKFRLDAQGWGVFNLKAVLRRADGSVEHLRHRLELAYPPDSNEAAVAEKEALDRDQEGPRRSVYLAAGTADESIAAALRTALADKGVDVWSEAALSSSSPADVEIERAIEGSDAVVVLSSEVPSKWVEREVAVAQEHGTRVIPVVLSDSAQLPGGLEGLTAIEMGGSADLDETASSILRAIDL